MAFFFVLEVDTFRNLPDFFFQFFLIHQQSFLLFAQINKEKSFSERSERDW